MVSTRLDTHDEIRVQKIEFHLEQIIQALLECCIMADADRMADLPTKESDVGPVEAKNIESEEDGEDEENND